LIYLPQAGNFVREDVLSAFIRLVAHTPELQAYTASKLYLALRADLSQESLTLAATWILGEYSEVLIQGGLIDDEQTMPVSLSPFFTNVYDVVSILTLRSRTRTLLT
jgi:AP-1 complex subunit gamma-1